MLLWTWQNKDFSLDDENFKIDSFKHSCYLDKIPNEREKEQHRKAYKMIFKKLETDQLIWCFTDYNEAVEEASIKEFEEICHCLLWELDIPENEIKWYCPVAWETLRACKPQMSSGIWEIFHSSEYRFPVEAKKYKNEFNIFWLSKTTEELLNLMFLKKPIFDLGLPNAHTPECSGALVKFPVDRQRIIKNPLEIGRWWSSTKKNWPINNDVNILKIIPCLNCPGRQ